MRPKPKSTPHDVFSATPGQLLLDNEWAPITRSIAFINADLENSVRLFEAWRKFYPRRELTDLRRRHIKGTLTDALSALLPLSTYTTRHVFVETTNPLFTAVFDNNVNGSDVGGLLYSWYAERNNILGIVVKDVPDRLDPAKRRGTYGIRQLSIYPGHGRPGRAIQLAHTESGWQFNVGGDELAFENPDSYRARPTSSRFTHARLIEYCKELGLRPFNADFYMPQGRAVLCEQIVSDYAIAQTYSLSEARKDSEDV